MATNVKSTKTGAKPSQADARSKRDQEKIDKIAMQMAKKGENEIVADEEVDPEDTMFTK